MRQRGIMKCIKFLLVLVLYGLYDTNALNYPVETSCEVDLRRTTIDGSTECGPCLVGYSSGGNGSCWFTTVTSSNYKQRTGADNPLDSVSAPQYAKPIVHDFDGDGLDDLMLGNRGWPTYKTFTYYRNIGTHQVPAYQEISPSDQLHPFGSFDFSAWSYISLEMADMNDDGLMDAVVTLTTSNYDMEMRLLQQLPNGTYVEDTDTFAGISLDSGFQARVEDLDADGDLDLTISYFYMVFYRRNDGNATHPSFSGTGYNVPYPLSWNYWSSHNFGSGKKYHDFADVDGDGDLDLFIATTTGTALYFRNDGTPTVPNYVQVVGNLNPLASMSIDSENYLYFVDLDHDGDLDVLASDWQSDILFFENVGHATPVRFAEVTDHPWKTVSETGASSRWKTKLTLYDTDGDGDLDLFSSDSSLPSEMSYYRNENGVFTQLTGASNPFNAWKSFNGRPVFHDFDGDGLDEAFILLGNKTMLYYVNQGDRMNPNFVLNATHPFVDIGAQSGILGSLTWMDVNLDGFKDAVIGRYQASSAFVYYEHSGDANNPMLILKSGAASPFNNIEFGFQIECHAEAIDIDLDGKEDVAVGLSSGNIILLRNTGSQGSPSFVEVITTDLDEDPFGNVDCGRHAAPSFFDWDEDGDMDILCGNEDGHYLYFRNTRRECATNCLGRGVCATEDDYSSIAGLAASFQGLSSGIGFCVCPRQFRGQSCEQCSSRYYGVNCDQTCPLHSQTNLSLGEKVYPSGPAKSDCICDDPFVKVDLGSGNFECRCPVGYGYVNNQCVACSVGSFKAAISNSGCTQCTSVLGTYSTTLDVGATGTGDCVCKNTFVEDGGSCTCPPGTTFDSGSSSCQKCLQGEYKSIYGFSACDTCPSGTTTSAAGAIGLNQCTCGSGMQYIGSTCTCAKGYAYDSVNVQCQACAAGSYKSVDSLDTECTPCSFGMITTRTGAISSDECQCEPTLELLNSTCTCRAGFGYDSGTNSCSKCELGFFKESNAKEPCSQCTFDRTTASTGSTSSSACVCPFNLQLINNVCTCNIGSTLDVDTGFCVKCVENTWKSTVGLEDCTTCPTGTFSASGSTSSEDCECVGNLEYLNSSCTCDVGKEYVSSEGTCRDCPIGWYSDNLDLNSPCQECATVLGDNHRTTAQTRSSNISHCICQSNLVEFNGLCGCPPGQEYIPESGSCSFCPQGTFSDNHDLERCTACSTVIGDRGTTPSLASSEADMCVCPATFELDLDFMSCRCAPGRGYDNVTDSCQACQIGFFSAAYDLKPCLPCDDPHSTTSGPGANTLNACICKQTFAFDHETSACRCPAGKGYNNITDLCESCEIGFYTDTFSLGECRSCVDQFDDDLVTTTSSGAMSNQSCICKSNLQRSAEDGKCGCVQGYGYSSGSCVICGIGEFSDDFGLSSCQSCETILGSLATTILPGSGSGLLCTCPTTFTSNGTICGCDPGYENRNGLCKECPVGFFSDRFTTGEPCMSCAALFNDTLTTTRDLASSSVAECECAQNLERNEETGLCGCPKGLGYDPGTNSCKDCPANTYSDTFDLAECRSCTEVLGNLAISSARAASYEDCKCPTSFVSNGTICGCDVGYEQRDGLCKECSIGFFSDRFTADVNESCQSCMVTFSDELRTTAFSRAISRTECRCKQNLALDPNTGSCSCPKGQEYLAESESCSPCQIGKFKESWGLTSCSDCPYNMTTVDFGTSFQSMCTCRSSLDLFQDLGGCFCKAGYGMDSQSGLCSICLPGFYSPEPGLEPCKACNQSLGLTTFRSGETACEPIECFPGYERDDNQACVPCAQNWYRNDTRSCVPCPSDTPLTLKVGASSVTECVNVPGTIRVSKENGESEVSSCEVVFGDKVDCTQAGITVETLVLKPGFWRVANSTTDIRACPVAKYCLGRSVDNEDGGRLLMAPNDGDQFCSPYHTGMLCANCVEGYAMKNDSCTVCTDAAIAWDRKMMFGWAVVVAIVTFVPSIVIILCALCCGNQKIQPTQHKTIPEPEKDQSYELCGAIQTSKPNLQNTIAEEAKNAKAMEKTKDANAIEMDMKTFNVEKEDENGVAKNQEHETVEGKQDDQKQQQTKKRNMKDRFASIVTNNRAINKVARARDDVARLQQRADKVKASAEVKLRIIQSFVQIQQNFIVTVAIKSNGEEAGNSFLRGVFNLDLFSGLDDLLSFSCLLKRNFTHALLTKTLWPLLSLGLMIVTCMFCWCCMGKTRFSKVMEIFVKIVCQVAMFLYAGTCTQIFGAFLVDEFPRFLNDPDPIISLRADPTIDRTAKENVWILPYSIVMTIVYPFGIPFCFWLAVKYYQQHKDSKDPSSMESRIAQAIKFLPHAYNDKDPAFECVELLRKVLMTSFFLIVHQNYPTTSKHIYTMVSCYFFVLVYSKQPYRDKGDNRLATISLLLLTLLGFFSTMPTISGDTLDIISNVVMWSEWLVLGITFYMQYDYASGNKALSTYLPSLYRQFSNQSLE